MGVSLMTEEDVIAMVQHRLDARTHWLIIGASPMGMEMMTLIESEFYAGPAGNDFDLVMLCGPENRLVSLAMAHKRRMSPKQFAERANVEEPSIRDVLLTPDIPMSVLVWLGETFHSDTLN